MLFSDIKDPRGYRISCTEDQWYHHILKRHPEMTGFETEVIKTIQSPSLPICQDIDYNDRNVYYSLYRKVGTQNYYVKVIVKVNHDALEGDVVTAFKTLNIKPGERMI